MRHNAKRSHKGNKKPKNSRTKVYDSNGPDTRVRGTAYQVTEKYELLAKDAETSGNFVLAENYRQHAEHYQRIINSFEDDAPKKVAPKQQQEKQEDKSDLELPASMIAEVPVEDMVTA